MIPIDFWLTCTLKLIFSCFSFFFFSSTGRFNPSPLPPVLAPMNQRAKTTAVTESRSAKQRPGITHEGNVEMERSTSPQNWSKFLRIREVTATNELAGPFLEGQKWSPAELTWRFRRSKVGRKGTNDWCLCLRGVAQTCPLETGLSLCFTFFLSCLILFGELDGCGERERQCERREMCGNL